MRNITLLGLACMAGFASAQSLTTLTTTGGTFAVNSGSFTSLATALGGSCNFTPTGSSDYAFRNMWAYRQAGETREYMTSGSGATFASTVDTFTMTVDRNFGNTGTNNLRFVLNYRLVSLTPTSPMLIATMSVQNIGTTAATLTLFNYNDYDVPGTSGDAISSSYTDANGIFARQSDSTITTNFVEHYAVGASAYRHGTLYSSIFNNTAVDNLNNTVTAGTGDFGTGFQWADRTLQVGESTSYTMYSSLNSAVPEPATMTALGLGVAALLRRRKKA
ncbi:MAG: PEP-CTERM sorting domain-containing protein [Armatimonadetes bacterium]|nr:PEP-CTERM sorting domain-containing protein [Armatimonadota bacterium]